MNVWEFGPFTLDLERRLLFREGKPISLGRRPFSILERLVASTGEIVSKEDLMASAWGETAVDEATLRVHIAGLRKVIGASRDGTRYITNVPSRGYTFLGATQRPESAGPAVVESPPSAPRANVKLPESVKRVFGREDDIERIERLLHARRCVTIVGAGGVGKTTTAIAAARFCWRTRRDGARIVELGTVTHPDLVPTALASALIAGVSTATPLDALVRILEEMEMLLVVDNCEHVIDAAATMIQRIVQQAPNVMVLATSREPLRIEEEHVYRLPSLEPTAAAALLVARAAAVTDSLVLEASDEPTIAEICRRLDGIPLALELAAGLVPLFGLRGLAAHLDDRLALLTRGARTALPRQRTLRATFDWSYGLLAPEEQAFFRRISVFLGAMSVEDAAYVSAMPNCAIAILSALADKSLVEVDVGDEPVFRLLESTRAYAAEHLANDAEERNAARQRHAELFARLFAEAEPTWRTDAGPATRRLTRSIDDVRAALDWAFGPGGDRTIGVDLTMASGPLWNHLSLYEEIRNRCATALQELGAIAVEVPIDRMLRWRMKLHAISMTAIMLAGSPRSDAMTTGLLVAEHCRMTLDIAEQLDDVDYKLRALWGMWVGAYLASSHREGLLRATIFLREAARLSDPSAALMGERMSAVSLHILGEQRRALEHVDRFLAGSAPSPPRSQRFTFDQHVTALAYRARIVWLLGSTDDAIATLEQALAEARALEHAPSMLYTLIYAGCPLPLAMGDTSKARVLVDELLRLSFSRGSFYTWARAFEGVLLIREGRPKEGSERLVKALAEAIIPDAAFAPNRAFFAVALVEAALAGDDLDEAHRLADDALRLARELEELWIVPELLRWKAKVLAREGRSAEARSALEDSLRLAREQGAVFWERQTTVSMTRLVG